MICPPIVRAVANRSTFIEKISTQKVYFITVNLFIPALSVRNQNFFNLDNSVKRRIGIFLIAQPQIPNREFISAVKIIFPLKNRDRRTAKQRQICDEPRISLAGKIFYK